MRTHTQEILDFDLFLKNFKAHLNRLNIRNSIQKDYILKVLYFSKKHLSVEEIIQNIKEQYNINIGLTTVYNTLKFFESINLVTSLEINKNAKKYELNLYIHHDHMICTNCHNIIEFNDTYIEEKQKQLAQQHNFILKEHTMVLYGLCQNCQNTQK